MSNLEVPVNNTPYSNEELNHFKELLQKEREQAIADEEMMKESVKDPQTVNDDETSSQDHHPADLGSKEQERETDHILRERNRQKIDEIDTALKRIENKTYGVCEDTGKKIQKERLEAIPYTRFSAEARKKDETDHQGPRT